MGGLHFPISIHAPREGSDIIAKRRPRVVKYFNPRSPCGERPETQNAYKMQQDFNPRSPRGERPQRRCYPVTTAWISIHAPRAGSDQTPDGATNGIGLFQSTLPVRGATTRVCKKGRGHNISIHAPRAGSDRPYRRGTPPSTEFQSTLPVRGATRASRCPSKNGRFQSTLPVRGATA